MLAIEEQPLINLVVENEEIVRFGEIDDLAQAGFGIDRARGVVGVDHDDSARARVNLLEPVTVVDLYANGHFRVRPPRGGGELHEALVGEYLPFSPVVLHRAGEDAAGLLSGDGHLGRHPAADVEVPVDDRYAARPALREKRLEHPVPGVAEVGRFSGRGVCHHP